MLAALRAKRPELLLLLLAALTGFVMGVVTTAFMAIISAGTRLLWDTLPEQLGLAGNHPLWTLIITTSGGLLLGASIYFTGEHTGLGAAAREYAREGRLEYRHLPSMLLESFISLWFGGSVGPEGPLTDLCGRGGTWLADRLRVSPDALQILVFVAIGSCFGALLGTPVIGAILALEFMAIRAIDYSRFLLPSVAGSCVASVVYIRLGGVGIGQLLAFPDYPGPKVVDLVYAVPLGLIGALVGLPHLLLARALQSAMAPLAARPIVRGVLGGVVVGLVGMMVPLVLFSGAEQIGTIIQHASEIGLMMLIVLGVTKSFLTWLCFTSGYKGGPVFPTIFIGVVLGLVVYDLLPIIPAGVCVLAAAAGFTALVAGMPIGLSLMFGAFTQPALLPAAAIGAVVGYTARAAVLPGHAAEAPGPTTPADTESTPTADARQPASG